MCVCEYVCVCVRVSVSVFVCVCVLMSKMAFSVHLDGCCLPLFCSTC